MDTATADWLKDIVNVHEDNAMLEYSSLSSPSGELVNSSSSLLALTPPVLEHRLRPQQDHPLKCPRCDSMHTKFCYYNNYSLSQPRYFCKTCRRYWTKGGSLRNVPVGGGCRRNRRSTSSAGSNAITKRSVAISDHSRTPLLRQCDNNDHNFEPLVGPSSFYGLMQPMTHHDGMVSGCRDFGNFMMESKHDTAMFDDNTCSRTIDEKLSAGTGNPMRTTQLFSSLSDGCYGNLSPAYLGMFPPVGFSNGHGRDPSTLMTIPPLLYDGEECNTGSNGRRVLGTPSYVSNQLL